MTRFQVGEGRLGEKYIERRMRSDATYQRAVAQLKDANRIVTVTLDLGIVQVNRAQSFTDPAARKNELEAAEKTFLAIRGFAGETDEYRMFLGQVYYWLGRSTEGKELFDQLLAAKKRPPMLLTALAEKLREVGEHSQARELSEEAYKKAKDNKERYAAAALRAHTCKDYDDKIAWLERAEIDRQLHPNLAQQRAGREGAGAGQQGSGHPVPAPGHRRLREPAPRTRPCSTIRAWPTWIFTKSPAIRAITVAGLPCWNKRSLSSPATASC